MKASLRALLTGVIDYAGLFPPATLPLDEAIRNYARYRTEPESWMLGRFICPAARLAELGPFGKLFQDGPPFVFAALGRGGATSGEFLNGLRADLRAIQAFRQQHDGRVEVDVIELRIPDGIVHADRQEEVGASLSAATDLIAEASPPGLTPFFEVGFGPEWRTRLQAVFAVFPKLDLRRRPRCGVPGLKLRCGGLDAAAFPSPEQVAFVLASLPAPLKATAGLHHPFRRYDPGVRAHMHGFLNVFVAAVLASTQILEEQQVRRIIEEENPERFVFGDQELGWEHYTASVAEVSESRMTVLSFGSCSFDEPRDDLRALGLL